MANSCKTCKHYEVEAHNEPCVSCRFRAYDVPTKWENPFKQKTNADRIRSMSDEEMAAYLADNYDAFCQNKPECGALLDTDEGIPEEKCVVCALEWLRSPAKEDK